jgi:hypothetical protein
MVQVVRRFQATKQLLKMTIVQSPLALNELLACPLTERELCFRVYLEAQEDHAPGSAILVECSSAIRQPEPERRRIALSSHSRLRAPFLLSLISDFKK